MPNLFFPLYLLLIFPRHAQNDRSRVQGVEGSILSRAPGPSRNIFSKAKRKLRTASPPSLLSSFLYRPFRDCAGNSGEFQIFHLDASFLTLKRVHPTRNQRYSSRTSRNPLQSSQCFAQFESFTENPIFECAFAHFMILFHHIWLKTVWIASL